MSHPKTKPAPEASSGAFQKLYLHHTVPPARAGQSVGRLLREALGLSPSFIAHLKFLPEGICLDGQPAHTDTLVRAGQLLSLRIDDGPAQNPAAPMAAPLDILWEDEFLVIVNKAPGMVVHGPERPGLPPHPGQCRRLPLGAGTALSPGAAAGSGHQRPAGSGQVPAGA